MAIIKCKMCGGDLNVAEGSTVAECEYCGSVQTVPTVDHEKKLTLFGRANRLRLACEFDKAAGVYESIVAEFPEEAEAYWGLVLCRYGIEYVDDPPSGKKIPTCHRSSFDSVMEDSDFEQTLENADVVARKVYREEAKAIEELRKGILEVSGKEEPYDIFICYKETDEKGDRTIDSVIAQDVYDALTEKGYRVFFSRISLEDKLGTEYEPYIFAALNSAKVMLAFGTDYEYYNAVWVKNEWSRFLALIAAGQKKTLIPCYKGIDAYDMPKEFQRLQAQNIGKVGAIQDLLRGLDKLLDTDKKGAASQGTIVIQNDGGSNLTALLKRGYMDLEDCQWDKAKEHFDQALNINAECAEAYLGLAMEQAGCSTRNAFMDYYIKKHFENGGSWDNKNVKRAKQFADPELEKWFQKIEDIIQDKKQKAKSKQQKRIPQLEKYRQRIAPAGQLVACGFYHIVGVQTDGTVIATGRNGDGQCNVTQWENIVAVAAGSQHTIGVKADGTVVATGWNATGVCNVQSWTNIVAVATGNHTVGLKADGTVVAVGENKQGQCNISHWKDIVAIAVGDGYTIGLKADGTLTFAGSSEQENIAFGGSIDYGQCDILDWKNIVAVSTDYFHTAGLKADGTVVATGDETYGECKWSNIVAISAAGLHTVGLKLGGIAVATGENKDGQCNISKWENIAAIYTSSNFTVGLKFDGTVVVTDWANRATCDVSGWKLFNSLDTLEQERAESKARAGTEYRRQEQRRAEAAAKKKAELEAERSALQTELANLKGFFTGKRRREIEKRLLEINQQIEYFG